MRFNTRMIRKLFLFTIFFFTFILEVPVQGQGNSPDEYKAAIAKADEYFKKGDYINAKSSYQYASRLSPEDQYPKDRLAETVVKLREKMARMEEYTAVLTEADNFYRKKEYEQAIGKYREASKIIPSEGYPEEKIREIEGVKDEARKKQVAYDDAIHRADKFVKYRKYEEAIESYRLAAETLPAEEYPRTRIEELEIELEALVEARNAYESIIDNADRLYSLKYYENAKGEYQKAADARPEDEYPKSMIAEIDKLLVKKTEFDKLVEAGDAQYMDKQLESAKQQYQRALKIYPSESYPRDMIDKINAEKHVRILTLGKPNEYLHGHKSGLVDQIDLGIDLTSLDQCIEIVLGGDVEERTDLAADSLQVRSGRDCVQHRVLGA